MTIVIADDPSDWPTLGPRLAWDDDAHFAYCRPWFETLAEATGQLIEPYDLAWFAGGHLDALAACLREVRTAAAGQPDAWPQCVGHSVGSALNPRPPTPVYETARRDELLSLLDRFLAAVYDARRSGLGIACVGD